MKIYNLEGVEWDLSIEPVEEKIDVFRCMKCGSEKYKTLSRHDMGESEVQIIRCEECGAEGGRVISDKMPQIVNLVLRDGRGCVLDMSTVHVARFGKGTHETGAMIILPVEVIPDLLDMVIKDINDILADMEEDY